MSNNIVATVSTADNNDNEAPSAKAVSVEQEKGPAVDSPTVAALKLDTVNFNLTGAPAYRLFYNIQCQI